MIGKSDMQHPLFTGHHERPGSRNRPVWQPARAAARNDGAGGWAFGRPKAPRRSGTGAGGRRAKASCPLCASTDQGCRRPKASEYCIRFPAGPSTAVGQGRYTRHPPSTRARMSWQVWFAPFENLLGASGRPPGDWNIMWVDGERSPDISNRVWASTEGVGNNVPAQPPGPRTVVGQVK